MATTPTFAQSGPWHGKSCAVVLTYDDGLNVTLPAHRELLEFLKKHEDKIWVTTLLEASNFIKRKRK
jgi:hypothetical protein